MRSTFVVVYDACVLHSAVQRDFLLRLAGTEMFQAKWSERTINEVVSSVTSRMEKRGRPLTEGQAAHLAEQIRQGVPDSVVTGYEPIESAMQLPDPDDRHVLAAAVISGAQVIVTENLADFPSDILEAFDVEALTADTFVLNVLDLPGGEVAVLRALEAQSAALSRPPLTLAEIVGRLEHAGLVASAARMRALI